MAGHGAGVGGATVEAITGTAGQAEKEGQTVQIEEEREGQTTQRER